MDNKNQAPAVVIGIRREPSIDPVKAQGILASVTKKEREAARQWHQRWGFLCRTKEEEEKEAFKIGLSVEEYSAAVKLLSDKPEEGRYLATVEPCTKPLPPTSSGMIGRRVLYSLEKYGPLVKTSRNYPLRPPLAPGQVYDPYKQTMIFLGSVKGDPISHKQSPAPREVTEDTWAKPRQLTVAPLDFDKVTFDYKNN